MVRRSLRVAQSDWVKVAITNWPHTLPNLTKEQFGVTVPSSDLITIDISTCSIYPPGFKCLSHVRVGHLDRCGFLSCADGRPTCKLDDIMLASH